MCAVRFMVMYVDESLEVFYGDGRRLQLSPCASEFMIDKPVSPSAHPLHTRDRVKQRTPFTISEYKPLVLNALEFRNKYATRPYLPEEFIKVECKKTFSSAVSEVEWPAFDSCDIIRGPHEEISVCSVDGHAKLSLSSSGEEFTVEYTCRCSQSEADSQTSLNFSDASADTQILHHPSAIATDAVTVRTSSKMDIYTRVIQRYSRASYPQTWSYALSLAVRCLESQKTETKSQKLHLQTGLKSKLPDALPLKCRFPHQHRWRYESVNPDLLEQEVGVTSELMKVVWCKDIIYRITDGVMAGVEISPGDGSVIRSNGALTNYFTHFRPGAAGRDTEESVYYLNGLPPDVSGQLYSVRSELLRASRILKCYIQARMSLRAPLSVSCRKETEVCDFVEVLQEVNVAGTGCFKALADGSAEVLFLNGVRAEMMWKSDTHTRVQRHTAEVRPSERWCQISLPEGHQMLVQVNTDKVYQRYMSALLQWCDWLKQTEQSKYVQGVSLASPAPSDTHQPITCRSVVSELEKIKRFNFSLENSPASCPSGRSLSCERSSDLMENCVSEALQKTSKAIQDINTLLSDKSFRQVK